MKFKSLSYVLLFFVSIFFISCEEEESISNTDDDMGDTNGTSWANSSWKKGSSDTYMDLTSPTPKFCSNGSPVGGTYSSLEWVSDNIAFFTLFNAGDEVEFRIKKSGDNLILAPWDAVAQQTHDPSTYSRSSDFPCSTGGGSGGGTGGGGTGGGGTGGGGATDGDIIFWTSQNFFCGPISVNVSGVGSSSISGFFDTGTPDCSNTSGGGNFNDLAPGSYSFDASCSDRTWNGNFTITAGGCLRFQLQ